MFLIRSNHIWKGIRTNTVFCLFLAFAAGIIVNEQYRFALKFIVYGVMAGTGGAIFFRHAQKKFFLLVMLAAVFLGALYCRASCFLPRDHIFYAAKYIDRKNSSFIGEVKGDVKTVRALGKFLTMEFSLEKLIDEQGYERDVQGLVIVRVFKNIEVGPGDRLLIRGVLHRPFLFREDGKMSYRDYLKKRQIYYMLSVGKSGSVRRLKRKGGLRYVFLNLRERMKGNFDRNLPEFEAGILKAVILGDRTGIGTEVREVFARTGTAHILAISGLHMGIVLILFLSLLGFLPVNLKVKYLLAMFLLLFYLPLAGARVSVLRSGIMSAVFLYSFIIERRPCSLNALGLAGLIILLIRPLELYSAGFQLSFSAVASLVIFYDPVMQGLMWMFRCAGNFLLQGFSASLSAWLGVAGWILYYFGLVSPIGLFANLFVIGWISIIIVLGFMMLLAGVLGLSYLTGLIALNICVLVRLLIYGIALFDLVPLGHYTGLFFDGNACLIYYGIWGAGALGIGLYKNKKAL